MKKLHFSKIYLAGLILTFVLFLLSGRKVYTHLTMDYVTDPTGDVTVTVYGEDEVLSQGEVIDGRTEQFFWGADITGISPIHYEGHEELLIENLTIHVHGHLVADFSAEDLMEHFTPNEDVEEMRLLADQDCVSVTVQDDEPILLASEELTGMLKTTAGWMSFLNLLLYVGVYTILYWYLFKVLDIVHHHRIEDLLDAALGVIGIAAMLMSWGIAFSSAYGVTVHPDEMQTRAALDYYRTHWIQPDVRSEFVAETVSGYGMTRLSEINLYYPLAGQFANLCVFEMGFRAFSMLMMLVLTCFILKNIKKERYMAMLFFATPQLWYLFSYATSDAYDYLFTVFAAYQVLSGSSALNRLLKEGFQKRQIPAYLGVGFIFANLLMAKKTFYVVLVTIFMLLLYRLIFAAKNERKTLFIKYMGLLMAAFAIVLIRYLPDLGYYGLGKSAAVDAVIEATAWQEYKPSTPALEQAKSTVLYAKGVTLKEFFTDWNFNGELFKSYFGYYGIYSLEAKEWYYTLMTVLYLALFAAVGVLVHKNIKVRKAAGEAVLQKRLIYWTMWGMILLMYLLTIYNAYFVDFQPQGRYLFPALPALACQIGLYKEVQEHKAVKVLVAAIAVMSLYSFYKIAYLNF